VLLGEVHRGVETNNSFNAFWTQSGCHDEGNVTSRREATEEYIGRVILTGIHSEIMGYIFSVLDCCGKWMFWGFAVIGVQNYTLGAGSNKRTEFTVFAEGRYNESRAAGE